MFCTDCEWVNCSGPYKSWLFERKQCCFPLCAFTVLPENGTTGGESSTSLCQHAVSSHTHSWMHDCSRRNWSGDCLEKVSNRSINSFITWHWSICPTLEYFKYGCSRTIQHGMITNLWFLNISWLPLLSRPEGMPTSIKPSPQSNSFFFINLLDSDVSQYGRKDLLLLPFYHDLQPFLTWILISNSCILKTRLKGVIGCPFSTSWYDPLGS